MNHSSRFALTALAASITSSPLLAQTGHHHGASPAHAPAGVMFEHMHGAGDRMVDYRLMHSERSRLFRHSDRISQSELQAAGFGVAPEHMAMKMHMLHIMYGASDRLNLMLMPQYMTMDMSMDVLEGGHADGHGHGGLGVDHEHGTSGIADTVAAALYRLHSGHHHSLHAALAISIPTGSIDEVGTDGHYLPYGMQLGSGTWDVLPSLTYNGHNGQFSWGGQIGAALPLESANKSGFSRDQRYYATGWAGYQPAQWLGLTLRLQHDKSGDINGHYSGAHNHSSPQDLQANYGGEIWSAGFGATFTIPSGPLVGQQLGVEWVEEVAAHYRGYQLGGERTLVFSVAAAL